MNIAVIKPQEFVARCTELASTKLHADQPTSVTATNVGVKECVACHSNPSPVYQRLDVTQFVRLRLPP